MAINCLQSYCMKFTKLALLIFFISIVNVADAQIKKPGVTIGVSALYANPQSDFRNLYTAGAGGEVKGGVGLGKTYFVASIGYMGFAAKDGNENGTLTVKPIKFGVKHYFLAKRLFVNADLGVVKLKDESTTGNEQRFTRDIGVGARLLGLEASIFYDTWDNLRGDEGSSSSVVFKLGYNITL